MQASVIFAAKSDGIGTMDCFRLRQMNTALGAFDHSFGNVVGS
jgi:hypothetical protein